MPILRFFRPGHPTQDLANTSNVKYEDAVRRYKMVQSENERALERADEFERYHKCYSDSFMENFNFFKSRKIQIF